MTAKQTTKKRWKGHAGKLLVTFLILLFLVLYLYENIVITVFPGEAGVLFRRFYDRGTETEYVYPEGVTFIFPWDRMYKYNVRIREIKQTINVLSQNGLTIEVDASVRFYLLPKRVPELHQRVGPEFIQKVIRPSVTSSVRSVIGSYKPEELYTTARNQIEDDVLIGAVEATGRLPIVYSKIVIENIRLPKLINSAIETKLREEQKFLQYEFRLKRESAEIERKIREARGIREFQRLVNETITPEYLKWKGIRATLELARSPNSKIVVIGGKDGLPVILNPDGGGTPAAPVEEKKSATGANEERANAQPIDEFMDNMTDNHPLLQLPSSKKENEK